jgi:hypothetical protein
VHQVPSLSPQFFPGGAFSLGPILLADHGEIIESRRSGAHSFATVAIGEPIPIPALVRCLMQTGTASTELPQILFQHGQVLELYPDTVISLEVKAIRLLRGRLRFRSEQSDNQRFHLGSRVAYLEKGEIWLDMPANSPGKVALRKGGGWIKDQTRQTIVLTAGQQIRLEEKPTGSGKPSEIDSSWKHINPGFLAMPTHTWDQRAQERRQQRFNASSSAETGGETAEKSVETSENENEASEGEDVSETTPEILDQDFGNAALSSPAPEEFSTTPSPASSPVGFTRKTEESFASSAQILLASPTAPAE